MKHVSLYKLVGSPDFALAAPVWPRDPLPVNDCTPGFVSDHVFSPWFVI